MSEPPDTRRAFGPRYPGTVYPGTCGVFGYPGPNTRRVIGLARSRTGNDRSRHYPSGTRVDEVCTYAHTTVRKIKDRLSIQINIQTVLTIPDIVVPVTPLWKENKCRWRTRRPRHYTLYIYNCRLLYILCRTSEPDVSRSFEYRVPTVQSVELTAEILETS